MKDLCRFNLGHVNTDFPSFPANPRGNARESEQAGNLISGCETTPNPQREDLTMKSRMICQALLLTLVFGSIAWGGQMPQSINSDKDLKSALKAARTPEDHMRIAAYCKGKAERLDAQAAGYEEAAAAYRNGPVVKNLMAPNTAARYESIAKGFREQARSNRELAASHEQMAKMAHKPLSEIR
jgi:hypothetical protein